jgi:hypothetical protein
MSPPPTYALRPLAGDHVPGSVDVYVSEDELRAEHAFWVFGLPLLVLHYRIQDKAE